MVDLLIQVRLTHLHPLTLTYRRTRVLIRVAKPYLWLVFL